MYTANRHLTQLRRVRQMPWRENCWPYWLNDLITHRPSPKPMFLMFMFLYILNLYPFTDTLLRSHMLIFCLFPNQLSTVRTWDWGQLCQLIPISHNRNFFQNCFGELWRMSPLSFIVELIVCSFNFNLLWLLVSHTDMYIYCDNFYFLIGKLYCFDIQVF